MRRPLNRNEPVRVGTVLSRGARRPIRVRWDDNGEEEDARTDSRTSLARRGSLRHQALVDPSPIAELFAADPRGVILRLLRESGTAMSATDVKGQLHHFGLDKEAVARAWAAAQKAFAKNEQVQREGKTYRWVGEDEGATSAGTPQRALVAPGGERSPGAATVADGAVQGPAAKLLDELQSSVGEERSRRILECARTPLAVGVGLGKMDQSEANRVLAALDGDDRAMITAVLLAVPKHLKALDAPEVLSSIGPPRVEAVLAHAAAEARGGARSESIREAAAWLVRRVASAGSVSPKSAGDIVELAAVIAESPRHADLEVLDGAARILARIVPQLAPEAWAKIDLDKIASAVRLLPFKPDSGRVVLLAAVGKTRPDKVEESSWWTGVTLRDLAACAAGVLGGVTSLPAVGERVVQPLAAQEVSRTTSRANLAYLLALPRELARQLPTDGVAAAFRRAARQDPLVGAWVESLVDTGEAERLRRDLEQLRSTAAAASERAVASERRAQELADRCDRLEAALQHQHLQTGRLRASQERQLKIDTLRALADLAAEVEELAANDTPSSVLVERVHGIVTVQGIEPIDKVGSDVGFDPSLHEPIIGSPAAGDVVNVIRPGYRWQSESEPVILHRSTVAMT